MEELTCRRCDSKLEPGWLLENVTLGRKHSTYFVEPTIWIEGEAEPFRDQWGGVEGEGYNIAQRTVLQTIAYRCSGCGLLELYAQPFKEQYVRP